jgi:hypothetical protein
MIQLLLPLHECVAEPLQDVVESVADPAVTEATANPTATELFHSATDPAGFDAALTETFCLCVQF